MIPPDLLAFLDDLMGFWSARTWDPIHGGYGRDIDADGTPRPEPMRLCLVQARCLYAFSHAAAMTGNRAFVSAAERAYAFLTRRMRHESGLWVAAADPRKDGPRDERVDFYDQAFVVFALAWWARVADDPVALTLAGKTMEALDRHLADPVHGGWREDGEGSLPRRQNPHMHLLEALHALHETTGDPRWLARADSVIDLFRRRFHDPATDTVREFLAADLSPLPGERGLWREPGHGFEWVWLLVRHARLTGDPSATVLAAALHAKAVATGIDRADHVVEAVAADGRVLDGAHLLWPQTEAVKAALVMDEVLGGRVNGADRLLETLFRVHFPERGPVFVNRVAPDGTPLSEAVPTRLLYHLVLCLAEVRRHRSEGQAMPSGP